MTRNRKIYILVYLLIKLLGRWMMEESKEGHEQGVVRLEIHRTMKGATYDAKVYANSIDELKEKMSSLLTYADSIKNKYDVLEEISK